MNYKADDASDVARVGVTQCGQFVVSPLNFRQAKKSSSVTTLFTLAPLSYPKILTSKKEEKEKEVVTLSAINLYHFGVTPFVGVTRCGPHTHALWRRH